VWAELESGEYQKKMQTDGSTYSIEEYTEMRTKGHRSSKPKYTKYYTEPMPEGMTWVTARPGKPPSND
jgi:DNA-binding protein H-NS